VFVFFLLLAGLGLTAAAAPLDNLRREIAAHISQPRFDGAIWGIKAMSLKDGRTWYEHNADTLLIPASNAKLFTGALALDRLGADFRFETTLYSKGRVSNAGTLRGDLIVHGRGDPTFAARFNDADYRRSLLPVHRALKGAGVKRITGAIVGDESFFQGPRMGSDWAWDDLQEYYGAETSALTVDDNVIDVTVTPGKREGDPCRIVGKPGTEVLEYINRTATGGPDSERRIRLHRPVGENRVFVDGSLPLGGDPHIDAVAVHDPSRLFVEQLERTLKGRGVRVSGRTRTIDWRRRLAEPLEPGKLNEIAVVKSRPLAEILPVMMKRSQNLYAQLFLLQVGETAVRSGAVDVGPADPVFRVASEAAGLAELGRFLGELGISERDVLLREGSGLSRACLIKPSAAVTLLRRMRKHAAAEVFLDSLPVAGRDGTLRWRMKGTKAEGNVRAKTGTLRHVSALSGYVTAANGEPLAFSIMLNHFRHPDPEGSARAELDRIAVMLAEFDGR
jgi:D-alanyl-D-alanine carboxypeptidase/D-alanyl-D-alanine-endopeptidase (penicillin-binding protein 4)